MNGNKLIPRIWTFILCASAVILLYITLNDTVDLTGQNYSLVTVWLIVIVISFFSEYTDSSLGMGYGTILTPTLMILGFSPLQVVPALLLAETISGITAGLLHHSQGNVNLGKNTQERKATLILAVCSIFGALISVLVAVSIPKEYVKIYIAVMLFAIGFFLTFGERILGSYTIRKIWALGIIAAFNKGISGGGYGPLITGGQVLMGEKEKSAIGITSFAEGCVCFVALLTYYFTNSSFIDFELATPLVIGSFLSVPAAVLTVRVLPPVYIRKIMAGSMVFLAILTVINLLI